MWLLGLFTNKRLVSIGASIIVAGLVGLYIASLKYKINSLEEDLYTVKKERDETLKKLRDVTMLQNTLADRVRHLENIKPKIKYKTIEKIREVKSNECKKTKDILDEIRDLKFDDL